MKVVVCIKQTPSTTATFTLKDGQLSWNDMTGGKANIVNPWDEYAIEESIRLKEKVGSAHTIAITVGPDEAKEVLKTALAMGCDSAVLIDDKGLSGMSGAETARILATAIKKSGATVAFFGKQAIDGDTGMTPMMTARALNWTALTYVSAIRTISDQEIVVERMLEQGVQTVRAALPVVISVVKEINEPRYPSFMGIRKANKAEIPVWKGSDLLLQGPSTTDHKVDWSKLYTPPARVSTTEFITGSAQQIAETLADKLFAEKAI